LYIFGEAVLLVSAYVLATYPHQHSSTADSGFLACMDGYGSWDFGKVLGHEYAWKVELSLVF
jgi:hypothetical protein